MPKNFSLTLKRESAFVPRKARPTNFFEGKPSDGRYGKEKVLGISNIEIDMK